MAGNCQELLGFHPVLAVLVQGTKFKVQGWLVLKPETKWDEMRPGI
jgi:hypothetical protein